MNLKKYGKLLPMGLLVCGMIGCEKVDKNRSEKVDKTKSTQPVKKRELGKAKTKVENIPSKKVTSIQLIASGRGESADWGVKGLVDFSVTSRGLVVSELINKNRAGGTLSLTEQRSFKVAEQMLEVNNTDLRADFRTKQWSPYVALLSGAAVKYGSPYIKAAGGAGLATVALAKHYDKKSVCKIIEQFGFLGELGGKLAQSQIKDRIKKYVENNYKNMKSKVEKVVDRSYQIKYDVDEKTNVVSSPSATTNGGDELDKDEKRFVSRSNYLMDFFLIDGNPKVGDKWTLYAYQLDDTLAPFIGGSLDGKLNATRLNDAPDGTWVIQLEAKFLRVMQDDKRSSQIGELRDFNACFNLTKNRVVTGGYLKSKLKLTKVSKDHILWQSRVKGFLDLKGRISTQVTQ